jgi:hypothetical protein
MKRGGVIPASVTREGEGEEIAGENVLTNGSRLAEREGRGSGVGPIRG